MGGDVVEVTDRPGPERRLELLDVPRFVAAIAVVSYHYLFNGIVNGKIASSPSCPRRPRSPGTGTSGSTSSS
jgi:peptidoglycan/LPS O-acetylase OafA/YrhL